MENGLLYYKLWNGWFVCYVKEKGGEQSVSRPLYSRFVTMIQCDLTMVCWHHITDLDVLVM